MELYTEVGTPQSGLLMQTRLSQYPRLTAWAAYQRSLELGKEKPGHIADVNEDEEK